MSQALSIRFRPECNLEYVHSARGCVPTRCRLKLFMPIVSSAVTSSVIKDLLFWSVSVLRQMARRRPPDDPKAAALRAAGALLPRPQSVGDQAFAGGHDFFDPRDRVQVKYEMVRRHRVDGRPVSQVAPPICIGLRRLWSN